MGRLIPLLAVVCWGAAASPALAQATADVPVSRLLRELSLAGAVAAPGSAGDHSQHFVPGAQALAALDNLNRSIALQVGGFPLGPTSTSVVFAPEAGTDQRVRFGSGYAAGAHTLGRGRRALAFTYQMTTHEKYDGLNLRDSGINLFLEHACCTGDPSERDLMQQTISLRLNRKVAALVLDYGLTGWFDVGIVVPFVQVDASARVASRILRTATAATPGLHAFDEIDLANRTLPSGHQPPEAGVAGSGSSTARGFGDVVLRGKLRLVEGRGHALAFGVDLKLPSGDSDELIGLGATQVTPALMWSMSAGRFRARVRGSYTRSSGELSPLVAAPGVDLNVPDEVGYDAGFDLDLAPRTTLVVDVAGRQVERIGRFRSADVVLSSRGPGPLPSASFVAAGALQDAGLRTADLTLGSVGARFHFGGAVFANLRVLVPIGNVGLRPAPAVVFGLDYGY